MLTAGDVFVWRRFPDVRDVGSRIKDRWFICLGFTTQIAPPVFVFLSTTTTQTRHYDRGGSRAGNIVLRFAAGEFGFPEDCLVDLSEPPYDYDIQLLAADDISVEGRLDQNHLRRLYDCVLKSRVFPRKVKSDIHNSLNLAGITGLARP